MRGIVNSLGLGSRTAYRSFCGCAGLMLIVPLCSERGSRSPPKTKSSPDEGAAAMPGRKRADGPPDAARRAHRWPAGSKA